MEAKIIFENDDYLIINKPAGLIVHGGAGITEPVLTDWLKTKYPQIENVGDDPINNRIFGVDFNYSDEVPIVTKLLDKLPFYSTKEKSNINITAEAAYIKPGHSKAINTPFDNTGIANIDDFEGAITNLNLGGFNFNQWSLSSTPSATALSKNQFREADLDDDLAYGANRAKLNWYVMDLGTNRTNQDNTNPYTRIIQQNELFTNVVTQASKISKVL